MIGVAVVLYKPHALGINVLLNSILNQVDVVSIIDNSPIATPLEIDLSGVYYHHFASNIGIAAAHNIGINDLLTSKCNYAMLLDQDSDIEPDMVEHLQAHLIASKEKSHALAAVGPRIVCAFSDKKIKPRVQRETARFDNMVCVTQIISSGMMIDLSKIEQIGLKDEGLFIDGVDHEWCWRAKKNNFTVGIAENIEMVHRLGDARGKFAGITYKVGSPIRLYYQFRNVCILVRRSYVPTYWKIRNVAVLPMRFFANSILQPERFERLGYMLKGLYDGLLGRTGKYNDNW